MTNKTTKRVWYKQNKPGGEDLRFTKPTVRHGAGGIMIRTQTAKNQI